MNKTAIKNFAIWARNKLIADIIYRAGLMGITADGIQNALPQSTGTTEFYDIGTAEPYTIAGEAVKQRRHLVDLICTKEKETNYKTAYKYVLEEVAYTWFNRLIAVRFMEVNDYLPSHIRVLSSDSGKMEPDLVTTPFDAELSFTRDEEQMVYRLKQENKIDELFRILFIKQCNALNEILSALFEKTSDYTELLLNLSVVDRDSVVYHLVHDIPEEDFDVERGGQVEIIGWLYQYYNTEPKNQAFAKKGKITKEEVPAVTQLFTPDWIVRYMVENSVGRLWIEHLRALDETADEAVLAAGFGWKYYLPEAKQEPEVEVKLKELIKERASLTPEQITMIDPCMGSGHILVYAFDVLMQIYENAGYGQRDAAKCILENNLFGLDIDDRAYQLAYFAVMMKARAYNRRILNGENSCKIYAIQESNGITDAALGDMGANLPEEDLKKALKEIKGLIAEFKNAKEYGSILNIEKRNWELLRCFAVPNVAEGQLSLDLNGTEIAAKKLQEIIDVAEILAKRYYAACTNPPYMPLSSSSPLLYKFLKSKYPAGRNDLYAAFIEKNLKWITDNGYLGMITQHSWMFLSRSEELRREILGATIINLTHLGTRAFEDIGGEVVQTVTFVLKKAHIKEFLGTYVRLVDYASQKEKEEAFLKGLNRFKTKTETFSRVPGNMLIYWQDEQFLSNFDNKLIGDAINARVGLDTGDNDKYLRLWEEISFDKLLKTATTSSDVQPPYKWVPHTKGGAYRKWYGNFDWVIAFDSKNYTKLLNSGNHLPSRQFYFLEGITWSRISTSAFAVRYTPPGMVFNSACPTAFANEEILKYALGLLNSVIVDSYVTALSPTMNFQAGDIDKVPFIYNKEKAAEIINLVNECITLSKADWDEYETSMDFVTHPLAINEEGILLRERFTNWETETNKRFYKLKENEETINKVFIDLYHLDKTLSADVDTNNVSVRKADLHSSVTSLLSYTVGCMFGRYSLDNECIAYAGGEWDTSKYASFLPDADNVIPITDEEYLEDDIVSRLCTWLKEVYGESALEENLDFIAKALGNKGSSSREIIRNYFLNDFFKDHCQTYSVTGSGKRPIYWLFDSGKQNGFKALIYLHRYNADTIGNLRIDYLHRMQRIYESEISRMQDMIDHSTNTREVAQATKRREKLTKQLKECREYDEKLAHLALSRIELDLDDGVKKNYRKIQTANDGKFYEVLADSKNIMSKE